MKFLAFILSIYIFALNLSPCEDNVTLDNEVQTEISQGMDNDHQHQDSDLCSPFCICQCCHVSAVHFDIPDLKLGISFISTKDVLYLSGSEKDFTNSVLQPPQV